MIVEIGGHTMLELAHAVSNHRNKHMSKSGSIGKVSLSVKQRALNNSKGNLPDPKQVPRGMRKAPYWSL